MLCILITNTIRFYRIKKPNYFTSYPKLSIVRIDVLTKQKPMYDIIELNNKLVGELRDIAKSLDIPKY